MGKAPVVWEQKMVRVFEYAQRMEGDRYFTGLVTCNIKYPFRTKYASQASKTMESKTYSLFLHKVVLLHLDYW